VSNFDKTRVLYDDDRAVLVGPEIINGTGEVYLDTTKSPVLSNAQARELAAALTEAADFAAAVEREEKERSIRKPTLAENFEWTDPAWRAPAPSDPGGAE
jgi:hypothetical protein